MGRKDVVNRQVSIFIESGDAQKVYDKLIAKQKQYNTELATATNPKRIKELRDALARLEEPISRAAKKISGELSPSLEDTRATVNRLRNDLKHMSEQDADFSRATQQYKQANKELEEQRGKVGLLSKAWKSFWQEAKTVAVGVIIGNTIQTALQSVLGYVTGIVSGSAKISDELADIQRVTGLTKEEVRTLNSELKKIDTRTSVSGLREIAVVAGQLGIAKDDILGFVTAIDKINVALGGQLGDVNQITSDLGKILNVFEGKITGENITHLGNAVVDLANKGVATAPFLVEYTQRLSGIAKTAKISLGAILGLAAGFEESGQKVESSSTALIRVVNTIATDIPKAAKIAGVEVTKFAEIFAKTPEEAVLLFAQGLQKNKSSFAEIASSFKDAGEEGARTIAALATLGAKTDLFRQKIDDGKESLKGFNVINDAFALKNNTAGAALDKFRKNFASLFTSRTFQEAGEAAIRVMNGFVNVIKGIPQFVEKNRFALLTLAAGILLMNKQYIVSALVTARDTAVRIINTAVTKGSAIATNIAIAAQAAYITITNLLIGRISIATAAQRIWNLAMSIGAGPLGIILVAVGALAVAVGALFNATTKLTAAQKVQVELADKINESVGDTTANIERLAAAAANENLNLVDRKKAIEDLIKINPEFANTLKIDAEGHLQGANAIVAYVAALNKQAEAQAKVSLLNEKIQSKQKLLAEQRASNKAFENLSDADLIKAITKAGNDKEVALGLGFQGLGIKATATKTRDALQDLLGSIDVLNQGITKDSNEAAAAVKNALNGITDETTKVGDSIDSLTKQLEDLQKQRNAATHDEDKKTANGSIEKGRDSLKKDIDALEARIKKLKGEADKSVTKAKNDLEALLDDLRAAGAGLLPEGAERELALLDQRFDKLRERAKKNKKLLVEIELLYQLEILKLTDKFAKEIEQKQKANDDKQDQALLDRSAAILKRNADILVKVFNENNRDAIAKKELDVLTSTGNKKLQAELALLKEQEKQELSNKDLTENEKLLIEEKYRKKRSDAEVAHWKGLINQILGFAQQALDVFKIFADGKTQRENDELERDRISNEKKKTNLERRLQKGVITQLQYDRELQKIEKEQDKREREIKLKQFKRNKALQLSQAIISTARAIAEALPNIALSIIAGIIGGAQIIAIAKQKPPEFGRGGKLDGRSHSQGGNDIIDSKGRTIGNIEKDEGIINKFSMRDKNVYQVTGTKSQIASRINSHGGRGVSWDSGAKLVPLWRNVKPMPMNFAAIHKYYHATGGKFGSAAAVTPSVNDNQEIKQMLILNAQALIDLRAQMKIPVKAFTVLTEHQIQEDRLKAIKDDATLKP